MRFTIRDLLWLTAAVAVGLGCWLVGYKSGCDYGRMEVNRALQRSSKYEIFRIDDNGKHFVLDGDNWLEVPDPPAPPPPPPPPDDDRISLPLKIKSVEIITNRTNGLP